MITQLIDKQDTFEIIRDKIADILVTELDNQQTLATAAGKDPDDWTLRVYTESTNFFEQFLNVTDKVPPVINIWFDNSSFDQSASNTAPRQKSNTVYNIDCYGFGISENVETGGHIPGDAAAAMEAQRAVRLIRNIIMSDTYRYLGSRGVVWGGRSFTALTAFQPQLDANDVQKVHAVRMALSVGFNETTATDAGEILETVSVITRRAEDGEILLETQYNY